jgi:tRNA (cytidine56-2'-O)-methyltransferase
MMIKVLRLGHRRERDKRITTHIGLVARAFGADEVLISTKDQSIESTLKDVTERFGGDFKVRSGIKWRKVISNWEGIKVHLTMYGEHINDVMPRIPKDKDLLIIVGAEKVPKEVFISSDFNVAVGNQPHSEVAALAVFLDRLLGEDTLKRDFEGKVRIIPSKSGKNVVEIDD